jgi:hypothetical protein
LKERYDRLPDRGTKATAEELLAIAARTAAMVEGPLPDHADLQYDERGLPM